MDVLITLNINILMRMTMLGINSNLCISASSTL